MRRREAKKHITTRIVYKNGLQKKPHDRDCISMVRTVLLFDAQREEGIQRREAKKNITT